MKNIKPKLVRLFKEGYCVPQISRIARTLREPFGTIRYNIRRLEEEGAIRTYKAVFDHAKIDEGFCAYVLITVSPSQYGSKGEMQVARELAKHEEVEGLDMITGEWDAILKVRTKDQNGFYDFLGKIADRVAIQKSISLVSLRQVKSDFMLRQVSEL